MRRCTYGVAIPVALLLVVAACGGGEPQPDPVAELASSVEGLDVAMWEGQLPTGASLDSLEEGRRLFVVCSVCHGLDARGTQLGPSLRDGEWIHITGEVGEIEQITRTGIVNPREFPIPMPEMGGGDFDDAQLRALAGYVHALSRADN